MTTPANDNAVLVSLNQVCTMTSLSRTAINNRRRDGDFPLPVDLGERRIGFVKTEVLAWIDARIAARVDRVAA
jgi:prophage regulatory protein